MTDSSRLDIPWSTLEREQEASWPTSGPNSEGVCLLVFARGRVWDVDGRDWNFRVTTAWTPAEFATAHQHLDGVWAEVVRWLRDRDLELGSPGAD